MCLTAPCKTALLGATCIMLDAALQQLVVTSALKLKSNLD